MDEELMRNLSSEERSTFAKLREIILHDYGPTQAEYGQIYRFLKARDFDLQKAEVMLRNHIKWRKEIMMSLKNFKTNEIQKKNLYPDIIAFTKEGEPVIYVDIGNVDFSGLFKSMKVDDFKNGMISQLLELEKSFYEQSHKLGKRIDKVVAIVNFENLHLSQVLEKKSAELFIFFIRLYEANAPERLKYLLAINASGVFSIGFSMVKPILPSVMLSKIEVFGTVGWKEKLLSMINEENLPAFLGGKKTDSNGNPLCNAVKPSGPIPKHFYLRSPERRLKGKEFVKEYRVKPHQTRRLHCDVNSVGNTIFWKFETECGDVSFGLFYRSHEESTSEEVIIPNKIVNAHLEMEEGSHMCNKTGIYYLAFDNSHSCWRVKRIFCKLYVINIDGSEVIITR